MQINNFKLTEIYKLDIEFILLSGRIIFQNIKSEEKIAEDYFEKLGFSTIKYPFNETNGNFQSLMNNMGSSNAIELKSLKHGFLDFFVKNDKESFFLECKNTNSGLTEPQINFIKVAKNLGINCKVLIVGNFEYD